MVLNRIGHVRAKHLVPHYKEWLWKVVFVSVELIVNVIVSIVVVEQHVEDVTKKPQSTMVIQGFDGCEGEKEYGCPWSHARGKEWERTTNCVQDKALKRMVVKSSKGIRDYKSGVWNGYGYTEICICAWSTTMCP
jgi:hypothetical protein